MLVNCSGTGSLVGLLDGSQDTKASERIAIVKMADTYFFILNTVIFINNVSDFKEEEIALPKSDAKLLKNEVSCNSCDEIRRFA